MGNSRVRSKVRWASSVSAVAEQRVHVVDVAQVLKRERHTRGVLDLRLWNAADDSDVGAQTVVAHEYRIQTLPEHLDVEWSAQPQGNADRHAMVSASSCSRNQGRS